VTCDARRQEKFDQSKDLNVGRPNLGQITWDNLIFFPGRFLDLERPRLKFYLGQICFSLNVYFFIFSSCGCRNSEKKGKLNILPGVWS